jgi:hypothetical protein
MPEESHVQSAKQPTGVAVSRTYLQQLSDASFARDALTTRARTIHHFGQATGLAMFFALRKTSPS